MDPSSSSQAEASSQQGEGSKDGAEPKKTNVRKRTKTGCITCRRRRIKCDELHPACRNCIKSKRYCEGYVKKLGWKPPLGQGTYGDDHHARDPSLQTGLYPDQPRSSPQGPLAFIAPRPLGFEAQGGPTGFLPTTYGPHHTTGDISLRAFAVGTQMPMPNPLLAGMGQVPQAVPHPSQQENQFYGATPPQVHHHQSWAAEDVTPAVPLYSTQQTIAVSWDAEDEDALDSDASMADSDDGLAHGSTVASARAQKCSEIFIAGGRLPATFGPGNSLTHYFVLPHHAIFQNPELQQAFRHFVENTAPVISMYERPAYRCREPSDKYSLWSFTLPSNAIKHPSLLHAIIALGSLQLANLQGHSTWTAMKQYHLSIRRVAKNVSTPAARTRVSTLAATLLLGYFEVYQSEHASWCNHLFGASILLGEMPIAGMTRRCLAAKRLRSSSYPAETHDSPSLLGQEQPPLRTDELDYGLLMFCTGTQVTPEQYGLRSDQPVDDAVLATSDKDIETFEILRDLLWWYNKLDVYQSFLGGSKLLRSYDLWTLCPPRARFGDNGAIYGTYDHVILLLGRLANFASKDLIRKRKAARPQPKGDSPQFPGIVPTTQRVTAPRGFGSTKGKGHSEDLNEDATLDISVKDALREWDSIREAFDVMKSYLQANFKPLSERYSDRRDSPFGTPLQYESYAMAGIWMNYYMGMIQLHRYHPNMPPAAMPAAHQADSATKEYAIMIGRIAAGLTNRSTWEYPKIDVHVAAAFVESAFCLFVAGVQYQDNGQRHWTVRRMHDIVYLVGWKTGVQIANALEGGWTKVAQMGRGPPYTRAQDLGSRMPRPWENPRRVDRLIVKGLGDEARGTLANPGRANLALGLIGIEDDLHALELDE